MKPVNKMCIKCSSPSILTCSGCSDVAYCSKKHQKEHWEQHKIDCKLYNLKSNHIFGRYLEAARDIKQGELILKETPTIVGPSIQSSPICLNCYKPISLMKYSTCSKCQIAPFCNILCNGNGHDEIECFELIKSNIRKEDIINNYQLVMLLRCLCLRKNKPETWEKFIKMESHLDKRRNTAIWRSNEFSVLENLYSSDLLTEDDKKNETIQKICGILDVNTFELRTPGMDDITLNDTNNCIRGIYLNAAMMAHDCIGNAHLAVDDNFSLFIHASLPIKKGFPICFNYTNTLKNTYERQEHLREGKYFNCNCRRCADPTELETHMGSLNCVKCHSGLVIPKNSNEEWYKINTVWKCNGTHCNYEYKGNMIGTTNSETRNKIDDLDKSDINVVHKFLNKLLITYPPSNSFIIELKVCLAGLYSNLQNGSVDVPIETFGINITLCQDILQVIHTVEPGISRLKGILYYKMHITMIISANKEYGNRLINVNVYVQKLKMAEDILKNAVGLLLYEPNASPEGRLVIRAIKELKFLRDTIESLAHKSTKKGKKNINLNK